jgi:hypothetical protein
MILHSFWEKISQTLIREAATSGPGGRIGRPGAPTGTLVAPVATAAPAVATASVLASLVACGTFARLRCGELAGQP